MQRYVGFESFRRRQP